MSNRIEELKHLGWDVNAIEELMEELKNNLGDATKTATVQPSATRSLESRIIGLLRKIGMPFNIKGKEYLRTAISYCIENNRSLAEISMTKELYPMVAQKHNTSSSRVERAIRHACERTFDNYNPEQQRIFGNSVSQDKGKLTNSEFISMIVDYINLGEDLE